MFKVLIIDDEPIIRKGLKNIINWKNFGCEVCGEATDGLEGCEMIKKLLPDIVITDIRMPEVDGLSMIREIKDVVPDSKIIILTGYRDFDYVQEALKLGAFDFILKPSRIEELTAVVGKAVKQLRFQKERTEELGKLRRLFEQNIPVLREKLLYDVLYEINTNETEILEKMELFHMSIGRFLLLVVQVDAEEGEPDKVSQYDRHLYQFGIINTFEEVFSDTFRVTSIPLNELGTAFIIAPVSETGDFSDQVNSKCSYLQEIIRNCFGFTVTIAVSSEGEGPLQLPSRLKECREALEHKLYLGSCSVIFHRDIEPFFKYEDHSVLERLQRGLLDSVKSGNEAAVRGKLAEIFRSVGDMEPASRDYIRNFYWNLLSSINSIRISVTAADGGKKAENKELSGLYGLLEKCEKLEELNAVLSEAALSVTSRINSFNHRSIKLILRKAVEYLQDHYNEQVTLNEVADHTFVSTYYISRLFKRELGKNFVDYLNELRIEKAKELLMDVRYKTYEVAEKVGIPDAHYFSRLFKKHAGVTPTEFRGA